MTLDNNRPIYETAVWIAGNGSIEQDAADNWKPSKKTNCERIEGIVALVIGLDLASRQNELQSIYATPGNLAL